MMFFTPSVIKAMLALVLFSTYSAFETKNFLPVVYVIYGQLPAYLLLNIELASRHNDVVVISSEKVPHSLRQNPNLATSTVANRLIGTPDDTYTVYYEDLKSYSRLADKFSSMYVHLSKDGTHGRIKHELRCFQRWFILQDFMMQNQISQTFFGDGDSSVFMNIKKAMKYREHCSAVLSIDAQTNNLYWCAAGEASVWTFPAITDFTSFILKMYSTKLNILKIKGSAGSSVVDMSLLWLWWVTHQDINSVGWNAGRPYQSDKPNMISNETEEYRKKSDDSFLYSKKLDLPVYNNTEITLSLESLPILKSQFSPLLPLILCNGMDVVNRTVFDHLGGWRSGKNQSLNILGEFLYCFYSYFFVPLL